MIGGSSSSRIHDVLNLPIEITTMYGISATGFEGLSQANSRIFKIEYTGLLNPPQALATSEMVRHSTQSTTVPYNRMSTEVQRILRMGGKITTITPVMAQK